MARSAAQIIPNRLKRIVRPTVRWQPNPSKKQNGHGWADKWRIHRVEEFFARTVPGNIGLRKKARAQVQLPQLAFRAVSGSCPYAQARPGARPGHDEGFRQVLRQTIVILLWHGSLLRHKGCLNLIIYRYGGAVSFRKVSIISVFGVS